MGEKIKWVNSWKQRLFFLGACHDSTVNTLLLLSSMTISLVASSTFFTGLPVLSYKQYKPRDAL